MINVTIKNNDLRRLEKSLTDRAAVRAYKVAQFAADQMAVEVRDIIEFYFVNDRPANRRKPNTIKLINSFEGVVVGTRGTLPVDAVLRPKRGVNERKIAALEHGAREHDIPPGESGWLAWPRNVLEEGTLDRLEARSRLRNAHGRPGRGGNKVFATQKTVSHPGNAAYHFMAQARQRVRHMIRDR